MPHQYGQRVQQPPVRQNPIQFRQPAPQWFNFGQQRHQPRPIAQPPIGHRNLLPSPQTTGERHGRLNYLLVSNRPTRDCKVCTQPLPPYLSESW